MKHDSFSRLWKIVVFGVAIAACGGAESGGASPPAPSSSTTFDLTGPWTINYREVVCGTFGSSFPIVIQQSGSDVVITTSPPPAVIGALALRGSVNRNVIDLAGDGVDIPAGDCTYGGTMRAERPTARTVRAR